MFEHYNEVSLNQGSFPYILLLLGLKTQLAIQRTLRVKNDHSRGLCYIEVCYIEVPLYIQVLACTCP